VENHAAYFSDGQLFDHLKANRSGSQSGRRCGGRGWGISRQQSGFAEHKLQQTYTVANIAHAPLEPRAAVAEWKDDKLTVWTGTHGRSACAAKNWRSVPASPKNAFSDRPGHRFRYGGKAPPAKRRLKRRAWLGPRANPSNSSGRARGVHRSYFRPAGVIDVSSRVRADGTITEWEFTTTTRRIGYSPALRHSQAEDEFHRRNRRCGRGRTGAGVHGESLRARVAHR